MSSRNIAVSGERPAVISSPTSSMRLPEAGPRTMSRTWLPGSKSALSGDSTGGSGPESVVVPSEWIVPVTSGDVGGRCTTAPQSAQKRASGVNGLPQEVQRSLTKAKPTVQGEGWSTANCRTSKEVMNLDYSAMSASYSAALSNASSAPGSAGATSASQPPP